MSPVTVMDDKLNVLTVDYGGTRNGSHGGTSPEEQTVFWAAKGKSIKPGTMLSDEVENVDTATVISHALRLDIPENSDAKIPTVLFQDKK